MPPRDTDVREAVRIDRADFLRDYWTYERGEHVSIFAPTRNGKTTLIFQLLDHTNTPELPSLTLVMKPRDATVSRWAKVEPKHPVIRRWPPRPLLPGQAKPPGWVLWPKTTFDTDKDRDEQYRQFRPAILDSFERGNRILFLDELAGLGRLGLSSELDDVYERAGAMGCGLWGGTQRPAHVTHYAYNAAVHVFIGMDRDQRNRQRYREISGQNPDEVYYNLNRLKKYEFLYLNANEQTMCIVSS